MTAATDFQQRLLSSLRGLTIHAVEGCLNLERPAPIHGMAAAAVRGLAGRLLLEHKPECLERWFKPGVKNQPPAYRFETLHDDFQVSPLVHFRLVTWDPPGELLPAFVESLSRANGRGFGKKGAAVRSALFSPAGKIETVSFPAHGGGGGWRSRFATPLRIKAEDRWVSESELSLRHLILAAARRLNALSQAYGNGECVEAGSLLERCADVRERGRSLRWVRPRRRSSTQETDISLSGVVGFIEFEQADIELVSLLAAASLFHIGSRTTDGCGKIELEEA